MQADTFSPQFIEGFVNRCIEHGLDAGATEELFRKQANNAILSRKHIHEGFRAGLKAASTKFAKSTLLPYLHPDVMSVAVDCRIQYGNDPLSITIRKSAGMPEPDPNNLPVEIQEIRTKLAAATSQFTQLPLNQQLLISMLLGGGIGAAGRALRPSGEDMAVERNPVSRGLRGFGRGAMVGAGADLGANAGLGAANLMHNSGQSSMLDLPLEVGGALGGGALANRFMNEV